MPLVEVLRDTAAQLTQAQRRYPALKAERMVYRIGWFSTGRDEAARELLKTVYESIRARVIKDASIPFVFSNRVRGESAQSDRFLDLVRSLGIDLVCYSSAGFEPRLRKDDVSRWRNLYDREVEKKLARYEVDLIVLVGYMLIVGDELCKEHPMINLHPAVPGGPQGTWQEVIWELIRSRASQTGVMIHLVTPDLDKGPPITYCTFPIRGDMFDGLWLALEEKLKSKTLRQVIEEEREGEPLFKAIRSQGVKRELPLLVQTIKALAEGKIEIKRKEPIETHCLNEQIELE